MRYVSKVGLQPAPFTMDTLYPPGAWSMALAWPLHRIMPSMNSSKVTSKRSSPSGQLSRHIAPAKTRPAVRKKHLFAKHARFQEVRARSVRGHSVIGVLVVTIIYWNVLAWKQPSTPHRPRCPASGTKPGLLSHSLMCGPPSPPQTCCRFHHETLSSNMRPYNV